MQIACMLLLGSDALSWYFHANADETTYYIVRISNFSVFCINYIFMSFFATYVWLTVSKISIANQPHCIPSTHYP